MPKRIDISVKLKAGQSGKFSGEAGRTGFVEAHNLILAEGALDGACGLKQLDLFYQHEDQNIRIGKVDLFCENNIVLFEATCDLTRDEESKQFIFPIAAQVWHMIQNGELESVSLGMNVDEFEFNPQGVLIVLKATPTELSVVKNPAIETAKIHRIENSAKDNCVGVVLHEIDKLIMEFNNE